MSAVYSPITYRLSELALRLIAEQQAAWRTTERLAAWLVTAHSSTAEGSQE